MTPSATQVGQAISDNASGLLSDFELNRSAGLLLDYRRSIANRAASTHVNPAKEAFSKSIGAEKINCSKIVRASRCVPPGAPQHEVVF